MVILEGKKNCALMNIIHSDGEMLKIVDLGKWLLLSPVQCSSHGSGVLHYSGKLPFHVLYANLLGEYKILNKDSILENMCISL